MQNLTDKELEKLKFPVGKFQIPTQSSEEDHINRTKVIKDLPGLLLNAIDGYDDLQFNTPYRLGGWTVRQLIHHIADSHINAFTRFKLGLTEDLPTIRPYDQDAWCKMNDALELDPQASLNIIKGIHERWSYVLKGLSSQDFDKEIFHPEMKTKLSLGSLLAMYAWHSRHHLAHITELNARMSW